MTKVLISIVFFTNFIFINSQTLRLGISGDFLVGNKYLDYQIGPTFRIEYSPIDIPFSLSGSTRFYLAQLSDENKNISGETYTVFSLGVGINYIPINWDIKPFLGFGVLYNANEIIGFKNFNNFSTEMTVGLILSAKTTINFIVEVTQTFNKPNYDLIMIDSDGNKTTKNEEFNFNSMFLKLGIRFSI